MKNDFCAAIFDLDGTLVDSMWIWKDIDIAYLAKHGHPYDESLQEAIGGFSFHETALYFKSRYGIEDSPEDIKREWNDMAIEYYRTKVPMKPGAIEYIKKLREKGVRCGIATSNSPELLAAVLEATGLEDYMDSIHSACEIKRGKPAPDLFLLVANDLGVEPGKCMVFEDIPPGIIAGHAAGMKVCAVADAYATSTPEEIAAMADYYIQDFTQLL